MYVLDNIISYISCCMSQLNKNLVHSNCNMKKSVSVSSSVVSDSVQPHRRQPTRLPHPWDSPGKSTGVGCHFPLQCMKVKSESEAA